MTRQRPYSRLYWEFIDEFTAIYDDDHLLAWWVRLLVTADRLWPTRPPLPRSLPDGFLESLTANRLVIVDGDRYTVKGLDAERRRRARQARLAATKRWSTDGNAQSSTDGNAPGNAQRHARTRTRLVTSNRKKSTRVAGTARQNGVKPVGTVDNRPNGVGKQGDDASQSSADTIRRQPNDDDVHDDQVTRHA